MNPNTFVTDTGVELLTPTGTLSTTPFAEIKTVYFVREFEGEPALARRSFLNRPRVDGLWIRLTYRDGDTLDGVIPNELLNLGAAGFHMIPPEGAQRVFVPKQALKGVQVLGVVGSPLRRPRKKKPAKEGQIGLFEETA